MDNFDKRNVKKIDAMPHIGQKPKASPSRVEVLQSSTHRVASELDKINVNELTPVDALNVLARLKEKL